jgi:hypothetical protein
MPLRPATGERLRSSLKRLRAIVRGDLAATSGRQVSTDNQQGTVVDLRNPPERAQRFVVGVVLAAETTRKEAAGPGGLLFTMIDELNKYAPRGGTSPNATRSTGCRPSTTTRRFRVQRIARRASDSMTQYLLI